MPGRTQPLPDCGGMTPRHHELLRNYSISRNGFLPEKEPLNRLPEPYYTPWESILDNLPSMLRDKSIRKSVDSIGVLSTGRLAKEEEWRRAYVVLSFLAHAYIWGGEKASEVLPPAISVPFLQVSEHLHLPPVATYAALNLWNFTCDGPDFRDLDKLGAMHTFSGTEDEAWFYSVSVAMEAEGAYIIPVMLQALEATQIRDYSAITRALDQLIICIGNLGRLLDRMDERCDPMVFYHQIRPYLAGSKNMAASGLPNGVLYENEQGLLCWKQLRGGSNGQSSLIQFLDIVLGVEHTSPGGSTGEAVTSFHEEVRSYMPAPHRAFLEHVSRMGSIKELAREQCDSEKQRQMQRSFRAATKALGDFRNRHMQIVTRYIIVPSRKQFQGSVVNLATASSRSKEGTKAQLTGTGGTANPRTRDLPSPASPAVVQSPVPSVRPDASTDIPVSSTEPSCGYTHAQGRTSDDVALRSDASAEEEADVPREARLLCDAHGKLTFVGDCAPLSLFQTVRQIVTSRVDPNAFTAQTGQADRVSMLENSSSHPPLSAIGKEPRVDSNRVPRLVHLFTSATSGLVSLFENEHLTNNISAWINDIGGSANAISAVNYLVLAIGSQSVDEESAAELFQHAKTLALSSLGGDLGIETVQAFALITIYMLRACQINGAYLFFGIAARAAYSIGLHRTEVNTRFGSNMHSQRDRLWKSLRVLDLFLSISMGRPPSMSDIDCTVPCRTFNVNGQEQYELLDASVQILSITEEIVLRVYSRRKISLQLTEGISRQLRDWSGRWLSRLKQTVAEPSREDGAETIGACQVMSSYYYAVMLVTRPFLMYELYKRLPDPDIPTAANGGGDSSGRVKLANACIDAASLMAESVAGLVNKQILDERMPLIVSWLFASSLVLGVGLLGGFGRILEKYAWMSITGLEYFARGDAHALQYSLIAKSLLSSALKHLQKQDVDERLRITESSSKLFGLVPKERQPHEAPPPTHDTQPRMLPSDPGTTDMPQSLPTHDLFPSPFHDIDPALLSLGYSFDSTAGAFLGRDQQDRIDHVFGALNLFPLLDGNGHIDLVHNF
ncbi:IDO-domain-containing protein [Daldinia caldariorum]|uniref:IDO-domain-containing protein n=1 Tax=Daldinia caldariorum TaxID=326644 RepID=UPI002007C082|nr:IDO-domain-containing protein [Daldinia caldariorum]KAI1463729.1 IDO-domain-containing protein [Daldinia caldariorum]